MKILGISGSLRRGSYNTGLLRAAGELMPDDVEFEIWEALKTVPPYVHDDDTEDAPAAVAELRSAVAGADAVLIATPEYNASVPGVLKNALDWISRPVLTNPLRNKPAAVVGASTGAFGAVWAQAELRKILSTIGARTLDLEVACRQAAERFDENGLLLDDEVRGELRQVVDELVAATRARAEAQAAVPFAA
jgi:chromate reductase, NAD(P)H dehydrogenase (quinone)